MTDVRFDGLVKPVRRGGWSARGVVVSIRAGQVFETQIGPRAFEAEDASLNWLRASAAERAIEAVEIVVKPNW